MAQALNANNTAPVVKAVAVTTHDTNLIAQTRGLWVGGTGNLTVTMVDLTDVVFANVPVGIFPVSVVRVKTATTATNIVALY